MPSLTTYKNLLLKSRHKIGQDIQYLNTTTNQFHLVLTEYPPSHSPNPRTRKRKEPVLTHSGARIALLSKPGNVTATTQTQLQPHVCSVFIKGPPQPLCPAFPACCPCLPVTYFQTLFSETAQMNGSSFPRYLLPATTNQHPNPRGLEPQFARHAQQPGSHFVPCFLVEVQGWCSFKGALQVLQGTRLS